MKTFATVLMLGQIAEEFHEISHLAAMKNRNPCGKIGRFWKLSGARKKSSSCSFMIAFRTTLLWGVPGLQKIRLETEWREEFANNCRVCRFILF